MSLEQRFSAVRAILKTHNKEIGGKDKPGYVPIDEFLGCLKALGIITDEDLGYVKHATIEDCLPELEIGGRKLKPRVLIRKLYEALTGKAEAEVEKPEGIKFAPSKNKVVNMSASQLVDHFDPENHDNAVGERLREVSKGQPFIVFSSGRTVDRATTLQLLKELRQCFPSRDQMMIGEDVKPVYKIGELPDAYADENPLWPGRPLRPDGTCDQTNRSWDGVPHEIRQFLRVALDESEINVHGKDGMDRAHQIITAAVEPDASSKLKTRYQNVARTFKELQDTGQLPALKVGLGTKQVGGKKGSGSFDGGDKVSWDNVVRGGRRTYGAMYPKEFGGMSWDNR